MTVRLLKAFLFLLTVVFLSSCELLQELDQQNKANTQKKNEGTSNNNGQTAQRGGRTTGKGTYSTPHRPNGKRYVDFIFNSTNRKTETFAKGVKTWNGGTKNLLMDIYTPAGDNLKNRPCVVFIFGGGFFMKMVDGMSEFSKAFAKKGYVGVAIEYRTGYEGSSKIRLCLGDQTKTVNSYFDAGYRATQDAKSAVRYLKANAQRLGINPNQIFVGGHSAGAATALNVAYLDDSEIPNTFVTREGGLDDIGSKTMGINSDVAGIFVLSGAVKQLSQLDNNRVPTYLFHGNCDDIVNRNKNRVAQCNNNKSYPMLYGGESIYKRLNSNGVCVKYDVVCGAGHELPTWGYNDLIAKLTNFFNEVSNNRCSSSTGKLIPTSGKKCQKSHPQCN